jgi:proteasome beta subunit
MERENLKGTTTIGLVAKDGVVLGAESRATMGNLVANKDVQKIFQIQPHIGMTTAGAVGDAQRLVRIMQVETNLYQIERDRPIKVDAAVNLLANILQGAKYFPYWVQLVMGGYDGKPRLYSLDALGSAIEEKAVATGSGSPFVYGVIEREYEEGKTVKENADLASRAIRAAMERDVFSGNNVQVVTITKDGFRKVEGKK